MYDYRVTALSFQFTDSRSFHIFPASYLYITPRYLCKSLHVVRKNRLNLKGAVCAWPMPCFMRSVHCAIRSSLAMAKRCGTEPEFSNGLRGFLRLKIYDDLWWFMMIYDDLWWFMMIYDDLWWFMMIYDDLWWFVMICDSSNKDRDDFSKPLWARVRLPACLLPGWQGSIFGTSCPHCRGCWH